jgi:hypothetical protein
MKPPVVTTIDFQHVDSLLLLGTPDHLRWYRPEKLLPPRVPSASTSSYLWLALSDGRVMRGYAVFWQSPSSMGWSLHSWDYYGDAQGGLIPRDVRSLKNVTVQAWALMEVPLHPLI